MSDGELTPVLEQLLGGPAGMVLAFVWGALWGSFFNVVIVRVPSGESVVRPASHCRGCRQVLRWYDNIPIFSYLLLRGRCRRCGTSYSARYALVELLVALLALALHQVYVVQSSSPMGLRAAQFVIVSLFVGLLCAIALIDLQTMRIPNAITYPAIPVAVGLSLFMGHPNLWDGFAGALLGYGIIRLIADGYELLTGRQGMGYGDAKLLALIGGLLSWRALLPTLFLASLQGSVIGVGLLIWSRRRAARDPVSERGHPPQPAGVGGDEVEDGPPAETLRHARIPFGPFLSLAAVELLLFRSYLPILFPYLY